MTDMLFTLDSINMIHWFEAMKYDTLIWGYESKDFDYNELG